MEQSNETAEEQQISGDGKGLRSFNKSVLITVIALLFLIVGITLIISGLFVEKRIMAPGPIGSTDSITQPLA